MKKEMILFATLSFAFIAWMMLIMEPITTGATYNETAIINTTVNITNSAPIIASLNLQDPMSLTAYDNTTVYCNVTVYDFDNDTVQLNATMYYSGTLADATDDSNTHYSNTSCSVLGRYETETNFTCGFEVNYFANNGTWYCNATAKDDDGATSSNRSLGAILEPLVAIAVPTNLDFGDLAQGDISGDVNATIINAGNRHANISVKGWGRTENDNLAMNCTFGEIGIEYEKYNITPRSGYTDMTSLTPNLVEIPEFFVRQRTDDTQESLNKTYWKLQVPVGAGGICTGKILFSASDMTG